MPIRLLVIASDHAIRSQILTALRNKKGPTHLGGAFFWQRREEPSVVLFADREFNCLPIRLQVIASHHAIRSQIPALFSEK